MCYGEIERWEMGRVDLISEYRVAVCSGDDWGDCMGALFDIAAELYLRCQWNVPQHWEYKPSPNLRREENYFAGVCRDTPTKELIRVGNILFRYLRLLKHFGKDY